MDSQSKACPQILFQGTLRLCEAFLAEQAQITKDATLQIYLQAVTVLITERRYLVFTSVDPDFNTITEDSTDCLREIQEASPSLLVSSFSCPCFALYPASFCR